MKKLVLIISMLGLFFSFDAMQAQVNFQNTQTNNTNSSAIGYGTVASGEKSFASGLTSTASGVGSTTLGIDNLATGHYSVALGSNLIAGEDHAIVIGSGYPDLFKLENNRTYSLMVGFLSQYPTLFVETSPSYDKTGRVAIGNMTDPQAKLHIYSDEGENATLFLQPTNWGVENNAEIWLGNQNHGVSANVTEGMVYNTEVNHVFKGGDVYIEDIEQGIIMKSPDGRCWRGTLNNDGLLNFAEMESCPEVITEIPEKEIQKSENSLKVYPNPTEEFLTIEIENPENKNFEISLIDEKGVVLKTTKITGSKTQLYTGDLKTGVYFVQVVGNGQKEVSKVIRK